MAQAILRNEDFKSNATVQNVQGIIYQGEGSPTDRISSPNIGAIYIDTLSGMLWICSIANNTVGWRPFNADRTKQVQVHHTVQSGDLIGAYGGGSFSFAGNSNVCHWLTTGFGGANSMVMVAGRMNGSVGSTITELFNGAVWTVGPNYSVSLWDSNGFGAQNAGVVTGGLLGGLSSGTSSAVQTFDGSTFAATSAMPAAKSQHAACGTLYSGFVTGGYGPFAFGVASNTFAFNGSMWTTLAAANLPAAMLGIQAAGGMNGAIISPDTQSPYVTKTYLFNGASWNTAPFTLFDAGTGPGMVGSSNNALAVGIITSAFTGRTNSTCFNGSVWFLGSNSTLSRINVSTGGNPANATIASGRTIGAAYLTLTESHIQNIYRKLNVTNIHTAQNIGMAVSVTTNSLTATLSTGDVTSRYVANKCTFGLDKYNNTAPFVIMSVTYNINIFNQTSTYTAEIDVQPLSAYLKFADMNQGMAVVDQNNNYYPIISITNSNSWGIYGTAIVRTPTSTALSSGSTIRMAFLDRWEDLYAGAITLTTNNQMIVSITKNVPDYLGNCPPNPLVFLKYLKPGATLHIPYSNVSGTMGSRVNYGAYQIIKSVISATPSTVINLYVTKQNTVSTNESFNGAPTIGIGGIAIYQHIQTSLTNVFDVDSIVLGYNNKMHNPYSAFYDEMIDGY